MPAVELVLAKWNFTQTYSFLDGIHQFVADCSLALSVIQLDWSAFVGWLSQPRARTIYPLCQQKLICPQMYTQSSLLGQSPSP